MDTASNQTYFKGVIFIECNTRENIEKQKIERLGLEKSNKQGSCMKIIEYFNARNITVQFQDEYKTIIRNKLWNEFKTGSIINPYHPSVYSVGMIGDKYPAKINNRHTREYVAWHSMLVRCYSKSSLNWKPSYTSVEVCKEWRLYENFYEWLYTQENVELFLSGKDWNVDKDILIKNSKIYSPDTCVLVPGYLNRLFVRHESRRGEYPIGVYKTKWGKYRAQCAVPNIKRQEYLGCYDSPENAFYVYKDYKEKLIQKIAKEEFDKKRITEKCYEAMMKYQVEITD